MSEQRKYRGGSAQQKLEIVLVGLRGDRSLSSVASCRPLVVTMERIAAAGRRYGLEILGPPSDS